MPEGRTLVLAYPGCILFEVVFAAQLLDAACPVEVATPAGQPVRDASGFTVHADRGYDDLEPSRYRCLLVPGGNPDAIIPDARVARIVAGIEAGGGVVGGICAGVAVLGSTGVLRGRRIAHSYTPDDVPDEIRRHTDPLWEGTIYEPSGVCTDRRVVTARPERPIEFAVAVARAANVLDAKRAAGILDYYGVRGRGATGRA